MFGWFQNPDVSQKAYNLCNRTKLNPSGMSLKVLIAKVISLHSGRFTQPYVSRITLCEINEDCLDLGKKVGWLRFYSSE